MWWSAFEDMKSGVKKGGGRFDDCVVDRRVSLAMTSRLFSTGQPLD